MRPKAGKSWQAVLEHKCTLCPYATQILGRYKSHLITHSDARPFKCLKCPFKSKRKYDLKKHVQQIHLLRSGSGVSRPFPCPHSGCHYAAKHKSELNQHSKIHSNGTPEFVCAHPNCNYSTKFKSRFTVHARIHTGEKPYVCQFEACSYATAISSNLVSHSRTHTKERPYKCLESNCEYSTTQKLNLRQHGLTHKPKEGERHPVFSCPLCEYSAKIKGDLSQHIKIHTLEKWFKCDVPNCNYEAKTKQHLKIHKVVHCDEKPFACPVESCEFHCKLKSNLSFHLKTHSDERRYKCELCSHRGKTRQAVIKHLKHVHADPDFRPSKCTKPTCDFTFKKKTDLKRHLLTHQET